MARSMQSSSKKTGCDSQVLDCFLHVTEKGGGGGGANGKSETRRDAETGVLKSETETENFSDLTEKHIV